MMTRTGAILAHSRIDPRVDRARTTEALFDSAVGIDERTGRRRPDRRIGLQYIVANDEANKFDGQVAGSLEQIVDRLGEYLLGVPDVVVGTRLLAPRVLADVEVDG